MNDKKAKIREFDIFTKNGTITENGKILLADISNHYISFMRGENPLSFPIRLFPENIIQLENYPLHDPRGTIIPETQRSYYKHLPLVPIILKGHALELSTLFTNELPQSGSGLSPFVLEKLVHAGNIVFPATEDTLGNTIEAYTKRINVQALLTVFTKEISNGEVKYRSKPNISPTWLALENLEDYSPKFHFLIERLKNSEGCIFVYTRFVNGGAIPLALILEANGYTAYGRKTGLLVNGIQTPGGRQCALCNKREDFHGNESHNFKPAYYGILTGDINISPNNNDTIKTQRNFNNSFGEQMKIIIGSQIASEGIDLRFIRETHVIDSWYHLNKTEQILGRAIRFLSHCSLPITKRNTTVYLYTAIFPAGQFDRETADQYSYRVGFKKAVLIGNVTRIMKQSSLDCNLNHDAIIIQNEDPVTVIDSQGSERQNVNINDMPFTAVCDWIESCDYKCSPEISIEKIDDSSYDEYSARWELHKLKNNIRSLFKKQEFYQVDNLLEYFSNTPKFVISLLFKEIVNNKNFQIFHNNISGYIRYCNGYYIFQPNVYTDLSIPLSIRIAKFPVKRDLYLPAQYEPEEIEEEKKEKPDTLSSLEELWQAIVEWITQLSTSTTYIVSPKQLDDRRQLISDQDVNLLEKFMQNLEMVQWFHQSFRESLNKNSDSFRSTLLFYFWDEWLTPEEQQYLIYSTIDVTEFVQENIIDYTKDITVLRFLDYTKDGLQYICNQKECSQAIIDDIKQDKNEDIQKFKININTTGELYGFIVPKNGEIVFKTAEPPTLNGKLERGKECGNVSTMTGHIANLVLIGTILQKFGKSDFDLQRGTLLYTRKIKNSTRACTLLNLFIRFMDAEQIDDKRWFFRPIQSYYVGHKGLFRPNRK